MKMELQIKRSSTGKYHLGNAVSGHADCNRNMRTRPSTVSMAKSAPEAMLCEKCFSGAYKGHAVIDRLIRAGYFK
jgi:hypothetical protein